MQLMSHGFLLDKSRLKGCFSLSFQYLYAVRALHGWRVEVLDQVGLVEHSEGSFLCEINRSEEAL